MSRDQYDERARAIGVPCPDCDNVGWYTDTDPATGEAMQVQCEFCETAPGSVFRIAASYRAVAAEARAETREADARVCELLSFHDSIGIDFAAVIRAAKEE